MPADFGYQVETAAVAGVVTDVEGLLGEHGSELVKLQGLGPPAHAFPPVTGGVGQMAQVVHRGINEAIGRAQQYLSRTNDETLRSMHAYEQTEASGTGQLGAVSGMIGGGPAGAGTTDDFGPDLTVGGGNPHQLMESHAEQTRRHVAEVFHGAVERARVQPGDLITTADGLTAAVGADGRYYANGAPVEIPAGREGRVYRRMTFGSEA